jgi:hypothetical protein
MNKVNSSECFSSFMIILTNLMGVFMVKRTGSFEAHDNQGNLYTIYEFTKFKRVDNFSGTEDVVVSKYLETANRKGIRIIAKGEYEVAEARLESDELLRLYSTSPDAP